MIAGRIPVDLIEVFIVRLQGVAFARIPNNGQRIAEATKTKTEADRAAAEAIRFRQTLADDRQAFERDKTDTDARQATEDRRLREWDQNLTRREAALQSGERAARPAAKALAYLLETTA